LFDSGFGLVQLGLVKLDDAAEAGIVSGLGEPHRDICFIHQTLRYVDLEIGISRVRPCHPHVANDFNFPE